MYDDDPPPRNDDRMMGLVLGALTLLTLGMGIGYGVNAMTHDAVKVVMSEPTVILQELSDEEISELCADETRDERTALTGSQARVDSLQEQLAQTETELDNLRAQAAKGRARSAETSAKYLEMEQKLDEAESAIEDLTMRLAMAEAERDDALIELKKTVVALNVQIKETETARKTARKYKRQSVRNLWAAFVAEGKVAICDRGSRKRHAKCHTAVDEALSAEVKDRFTHCVNSNQATPALTKGDKKTDLPMFANMLSEDNRFTNKGWYIQFCDPTLPEAGMP
jgi:predicted  nucleic acid-binding Zn-ribbon protein